MGLQPRLSKFYNPTSEETALAIVRECFLLVSKRTDNVCNFLDGGECAMPPPDRKNEAISRALTKILRHTAKDIGLPIDAKGLVPISEILALPKFKGCTVADIRAIVKDCSKQRFRIETREDGVLGVAANQGKSQSFAFHINTPHNTRPNPHVPAGGVRRD